MAILLFPLSGTVLLINLACLAVVALALLDIVLFRRGPQFVAAGKQTKGLWIMFLVLGAFVTFVGAIAAIVYFVDVRPALQTAGNGTGPARRGSSSDGPYGPSRR